MNEGAGLVVDNAEEFSVGVAQSRDGDAGREVNIFSALEVVEVHAQAFGEDGCGAGVCGHHVWGLGRDEGLGEGVGGGISIREERCSLMWISA